MFSKLTGLLSFLPYFMLCSIEDKKGLLLHSLQVRSPNSLFYLDLGENFKLERGPTQNIPKNPKPFCSITGCNFVST